MAQKTKKSNATKRRSISRSATTKAAAKKQATKARKAPARGKRKTSTTTDRRVADHGNKLVVLTRKNPHREGTARYEKFEAMRKAKTIGDYVSSGQPRKYLRYAVEAGLAKIAS